MTFENTGEGDDKIPPKEVKRMVNDAIERTKAVKIGVTDPQKREEHLWSAIKLMPIEDRVAFTVAALHPYFCKLFSLPPDKNDEELKIITTIGIRVAEIVTEQFVRSKNSTSTSLTLEEMEILKRNTFDGLLSAFETMYKRLKKEDPEKSSWNVFQQNLSRILDMYVFPSNTI